MQDSVELLLQDPLLLALIAGLFGLLLGSFINVVVYRLPRRLEARWQAECAELTGKVTPDTVKSPPGIVSPSSRCPHCGHRIRPWENIPLLSFLLLRGRCSACGGAISWRYPLVELLTGLASALAAWHFGAIWPLAGALLLTWSLIALSFIDFDTQLLPDDITLPLLWLGLLCNSFGFFTDPLSALYGAMAGYLSLWVFYHLFRLITGKEGMGYGDFKLFAALGAWLGWQNLLQIILLSSVVGAILGSLTLWLRRQSNTQPIPFGPYLATAGWISLLWGEQINHWYLRWAGLL